MNSRYIRFQAPGQAPQFGVIENDSVAALTDAPWLDAGRTDKTYPLNGVKVLAPVAPSKIVCIGLNYHAHVQASFSADKPPENPLIFLKPPSAIINPGDMIVHPPQSERVDYEAELGVVIGKTAKNVPLDKAIDYIFGFTCVNDVTARDLQKKDGQWSRAKGFDTFCPVGPWIVRDLNWRDVLVEGIHNGETKQSGRTSMMIFDIPYLIHYITAAMTLMPGDLIATGTPAGIAPMKSGDTIVVRIEGIGDLENSMA